MLYLRIILLFTLRTLLNAIICCLQLNTQSLLGWYSEGGLLVIDAVGWRSMYHVVIPKTNLIVVIMSCTCIVMHSLFVNCPAVICSPSMLFICYGETPLVNCGPRSFFFYIDNTTHNNNCFLALFPFTAITIVFHSLQTNIIFHTIRLILCFQQDRWDWQPHCTVGAK